MFPLEKSGKRDSDPRPRPWQGRALPTELFPQRNKKTLFTCEEEETRTPTSQLTLPPQSSASTNSATSPTCKCILNNVPRTGLEPARRETHAPETCASTNSATWAGIEETFFLMLYSECMSGKRDSDPRPRPWQGRALPTELFPQLSFAGAFL